jgi:hypothetical protein
MRRQAPDGIRFGSRSRLSMMIGHKHLRVNLTIMFQGAIMQPARLSGIAFLCVENRLPVSVRFGIHGGRNKGTDPFTAESGPIDS